MVNFLQQNPNFLNPSFKFSVVSNIPLNSKALQKDTIYGVNWHIYKPTQVYLLQITVTPTPASCPHYIDCRGVRCLVFIIPNLIICLGILNL